MRQGSGIGFALNERDHRPEHAKHLLRRDRVAAQILLLAPFDLEVRPVFIESQADLGSVCREADVSSRGHGVLSVRAAPIWLGAGSASSGEV